MLSFSVTDCFSAWVGDEASGGIWGQVGYYICDGSTPYAFYQIWNLASNSVLSGGGASITDGLHTFTMSLQSGTTWAFTVDGTSMGTYNMGASSSSSSYPVEALVEGQGSSVFSIPAVTFSPSLQVLKSGTWSAVSSAVSYGSDWGVVGTVQDSALAKGDIIVSGALPSLSSGTLLWSSGSTTTTSSTATSTKTSSTSTSHTTSTSTTSTSSKVSTTTTTASASIVSAVWGYAPTDVAAGKYAQWQALVNVKTGTNPSKISVGWYLDGKLLCTILTIPGGSPTQGASYLGTELGAGTYTLYFVAGTLRSSTLTITVTSDAGA